MDIHRLLSTRAKHSAEHPVDNFYVNYGSY